MPAGYPGVARELAQEHFGLWLTASALEPEAGTSVNQMFWNLAPPHNVHPRKPDHHGLDKRRGVNARANTAHMTAVL